VGTILPTDKVVSIVARVADALATRTGKNWGAPGRERPANVMYVAEKRRRQGHDFGMAPDTDSSRPNRMVLGNAVLHVSGKLQGKKIDGRSDLFSLAVTPCISLFAANYRLRGIRWRKLMYRMPNEHAPDSCSTTVPSAGLGRLPDKAMSKEAGERYQTGEEFAGALRATCRGSFRYGDRRRGPTSACELRRSMMTLSGALEIASCTDPEWSGPTTRTRSASDGDQGLVVLADGMEDTTRAKWQAAWPPR